MTNRVLFALAGLLAMLVAGCGGNDKECGPGTVLAGNQCIVAPAMNTPVVVDSGSPDVSVAVVDGAVIVRPTFAGIHALSPASETSLVVAWRAASDPMTSQENIVYRVHLATASGKQDFSKPTAVSQPGATSLLLTGLVSGTSYFAVVRAVNQTGVDDANTVEKSNQPRHDADPPRFGGAKDAQPKGPSSIEVSWDPAADDVTPPEGITYVAHWSQLSGEADTGTFGGVSEPGATSMIVAGLPNPITEFFVNIRAVDAAGNSDSNRFARSARTTVDTTPPEFAGCQQALEPSAGAATLTWLPAKDNSTPPSNITYTVYASATPIEADGGGFDFTHKAVFKGGVSGRIGGLKQATDWYFVCRASDDSDNQETNIAQRKVRTQVDLVKPVFNGVSLAVLDGFKQAKLTWEPGTDDQTPADSLRYAVYQGSGPGMVSFANPVAITPPGAKSILMTELKPSTTYFWTVRARDEADNDDANIVERGLTTPDTVSFTNNVQPILTLRCAGPCHNPTAPPMGLIMSPGVAYGYLVNINAVEDQPLTADAGAQNIDDSGAFDASGYIAQYRKRIKPGDPENSYLYLKITGRPPLGNPMPPPSTGVTLAPEQIDTIKNWILQGALNN